MDVYDTTSAVVTLTKISPVWPTGPMMGYASSTGTHQTCAARFRRGGPAMKRSGKWSLRNRLAAACACSAVIVGAIVVAIGPPYSTYVGPLSATREWLYHWIIGRQPIRYPDMYQSILFFHPEYPQAPSAIVQQGCKRCKRLRKIGSPL